MLITTLIKPEDEPLWTETGAQTTWKECMNKWMKKKKTKVKKKDRIREQ